MIANCCFDIPTKRRYNSSNITNNILVVHIPLHSMSDAGRTLWCLLLEKVSNGNSFGCLQWWKLVDCCMKCSKMMMIIVWHCLRFVVRVIHEWIVIDSALSFVVGGGVNDMTRRCNFRPNSLEEHVQIQCGEFSALQLQGLGRNQRWFLFESDMFLDFFLWTSLTTHQIVFKCFRPPNRRPASESLITWVSLASVKAPGILQGSISLMKEEAIDRDGGWWKYGGGVSFLLATTMSKRDKIQKSHGRLIWV